MAVRTSFKHLLGWFTVAPERELDNQYWAQGPPRKQLPWEADAKLCWRRHHKEGSLLTAFGVRYWETKKFQFRKTTFYTLSSLSLETLEFLSGASVETRPSSTASSSAHFTSSGNRRPLQLMLYHTNPPATSYPSTTSHRAVNSPRHKDSLSCYNIRSLVSYIVWNLKWYAPSSHADWQLTIWLYHLASIFS